MTWQAVLVDKGACREAVTWAQGFSNFEEAWVRCERGDWLLWWVGMHVDEHGSEAHRTLVTVACQCARLSLVHVPVDEDRPRVAIETAERWARREPSVTLEDVRAATYAVYSAYAAASSAAFSAYAAVYSAACSAAYSAYAATYAAYTAAAAAGAVSAGAVSAGAVSAGAVSAAGAAGAASKLRECAEIVRKTYPLPPTEVV